MASRRMGTSGIAFLLLIRILCIDPGYIQFELPDAEQDDEPEFSTYYSVPSTRL